MSILIRQEIPTDHEAVFRVVEAAFRNAEHTDHREQFLVERLRHSETFVPELSLVAEKNGQVVGHILLTKIKIKNDQSEIEALALAPVSVDPDHQKKGIGGQLILRAHEVAKGLGFKGVVLLGHAEYYPRFGYRPAKDYGIALPFDVPAENCMFLPLVGDGWSGFSGEVVYPSAFFE